MIKDNQIECKKVCFTSMKEASERAQEINSENRKTKKQKELLRPYKCDKCGKVHLTKMSKHRFKLKTDSEYRAKIRHENFIKIETEFYERKYGTQQ